MNLKLVGLTSDEDEADGYILANQIGPHGRPICFIFAGDAPEDDGARVFLDIDRMQESVNYRLIEAGAVYPLFYDTLYCDLRNALANAALQAQDSCMGFWSADKSVSGVEWGGADSLPNLDPIFPKLWRRLEKYTQNRDFRDESNTLDAFIDFLETSQDRLIIVSKGCFTDLDNIVDIDGDSVRLRYRPHDLVFVS